MKAAVFEAPGKPLTIESLPDPVPGAGELVLRVGRCGICGTDLHMTDGHAATYPNNSVLGHEFAGEVVAVGRGVVNYKLGDAVAGLAVGGCGMCAQCMNGDPMWCEQGLIPAMGGFGQFTVVKAHSAIRLPSTLSLADGALIEPLAVGLHGVKLAGISPGARVLVLGSGSIGLSAAFWARRFGANRVAVASRSARGETHALRMGASHFEQFGEEFAANIQTALSGLPDVVFECVGVPGMLTKAIEIVRARGTVMILGNCMKPDSLVPSLVMFKQLRLQGSMVYSRREFEIVAEILDAGHVEARTMITDTVPLAELPNAFEALRRPTYQCKTLVDPWS
jgi:(R,R)-butanediol dehydrogenase/meso-butanediol dehydrogenase/diacetyl reductase